MLGAVGFVGLAVLGGVGFVKARRAGSYFEDDRAARGDGGDVGSFAPPSYQEKDKDVEREGEWEERVRVAV